MAGLAARFEQALASASSGSLVPSGDSTYFDESVSRMAEVRQLLGSKFDQERVEGMKHLIAMINLGRDMSAFFPDVIRIMVNDHAELKKLIFIYVLAYASENQELALLCINSIQRDLKDPNARTRANALRTITSIRVPMVVHLVVMALRSAVKDGSPFVRKIAAHALPKVVRTDVEQEGAAVEMVASLLGDREPMVLASAVVAFDQVCPQRLDLLHAHFRKLCHLLADLDEWGQIKCVGVLLHYGRTHFTTPFSEAATHAASIPEKDRKFYSDSEDSDDEKRGAKAAAKAAAKSNEMDPDHALLLRSVQVLFRSQNSGVVLAAAALFQALAPVKDCCAVMGKALVHACRAHPEMQYCVLSAINAIAAKPGGYARMFAPYLKSFYVLAADPFYVRELKLDIMASLASELNMTSILREFQAYCRDADKTFVGAAIQAIGRCALNVPEVAQACMRGLMALVAGTSPLVAARAVVVMRQLLQHNPAQHEPTVAAMVRLLEKTRVPEARAAIVWVIGEYRDKIPKLYPDALRVLAKGFKDEALDTKMQILTAAVKMLRSNPTQIFLLFKYVVDLCRYDLNYDLRDKARMLRRLLIHAETGECRLTAPTPVSASASASASASVSSTAASSSAAVSGGDAALSALERQLLASFFTDKPSPRMVSVFKERERYTVGTISHLLAAPARGYAPLPDFPLVATDPTVREPKIEKPVASASSSSAKGGKSGKDAAKDVKAAKAAKKGDDHFYSDTESEPESESDSQSGSDSQSDRSSRSRSRTDSDSRSSRSSRSRSWSRSGSGSDRSRSRSRSVSASGSDRSRSRSRSGSEYSGSGRSRSPSPVAASNRRATSAAAAASSSSSSSPTADLLDSVIRDRSSSVTAAASAAAAPPLPASPLAVKPAAGATTVCELDRMFAREDAPPPNHADGASPASLDGDAGKPADE